MLVRRRGWLKHRGGGVNVLRGALKVRLVSTHRALNERCKRALPRRKRERGFASRSTSGLFLFRGRL